MSPWKFPLLALLFLAFCNSCGDATAGHDLEISGSGDVGTTSYASEYGEAEFSIFVTTNDGDDHNNVDIDVSFTDDWSGEAEVTDCNGGEVPTTLNSSQPLFACIDVSMAGSGYEIGDSIGMNVSVTSSQDGHGDSIIFTIQVSNWFAYSDDGVQAYAEGDTNTYTITVVNIKVDENGDGVAIDDAIEIALSASAHGWHITSDFSGWDQIELKATINYLAANASLDLELDITLVGEIVPASSYVGNSFIVFVANDGIVWSQLSLEAFVHDNFNVAVTGAGNQHVDNGCSVTTVSVTWSTDIKNFGNRPDSFTYTFDTSGLPSGWTVDGATGGNTGSLNAKFEGGGVESVSLDLWIPGGLSAGSTGVFTMAVTSDNDTTASQTVSFSATVDQCYGLVLSADSDSKSARPGETADFSFTVTNTGNGADTFEIMVEGPVYWAPTASQSDTTISAGSSGQFIVSVTVPEDEDAGADSGGIIVTVTSSDGEITTSHIVSVSTSQVFAISIDYASGSDGTVTVTQETQSQLKLNITNNGNGIDTVSLVMKDEPGWATLGATEIMIARGQTVSIVVTLSPDAEALSGPDYVFQVVATSKDGTTTSTTGDLVVTIIQNEYGCTNPNALNYRQDAIHDDGSCVIGGCTDPRTVEYNPNATFDDGSCPPVITGCTDFAAVNYRQTATVDDGSCKYAPTAVAGSDITVAEGEDVQFSGAGTDSDGNIVLYEWDFDGDGVYEWSSEENGRTTNIYNAAGEYSTSLRVTDADGHTAVDERLVTVTEALQEKDEAESPVPSISLISALTLIALIAIFRRK